MIRALRGNLSEVSIDNINRSLARNQLLEADRMAPLVVEVALPDAPSIAIQTGGLFTFYLDLCYALWMYGRDRDFTIVLDEQSYIVFSLNHEIYNMSCALPQGQVELISADTHTVRTMMAKLMNEVVECLSPFMPGIREFLMYNPSSPLVYPVELR